MKHLIYQNQVNLGFDYCYCDYHFKIFKKSSDSFDYILNKNVIYPLLVDDMIFENFISEAQVMEVTRINSCFISYTYHIKGKVTTDKVKGIAQTQD